MTVLYLLLPLMALVSTAFCQGGCGCQSPTGGSTSGSCGSATGASDTGADAGKKTCPKVNTTTRNTIDSYMGQPVYQTFRQMNAASMEIDNICATLFPVTGSCNTFVYIYSIVYVNNTNQVFTYLVSTNEPGVNYYSDIGYQLVEFVVDSAGCDSFVVLSCATYGDDYDPFFYGTTTNCNSVPYSQDCLNSASQVIKNAGLCQDNYILPYNLPTQCVYRQPCQDPITKVYAKEGGTCKPNDQQCCYGA